MISRKDRDAMMKFVEGTREDKMRDKKMGYKEGSAADMKADAAQAKRMMVRGNKNQMPPKGWPK
jgi:hypothetical protein